MVFWSGVIIAGIYIAIDLYREYRKSKRRELDAYFVDDEQL